LGLPFHAASITPAPPKAIPLRAEARTD
jgi:hypothetical protein